MYNYFVETLVDNHSLWSDDITAEVTTLVLNDGTRVTFIIHTPQNKLLARKFQCVSFPLVLSYLKGVITIIGLTHLSGEHVNFF